MGREEHAFLQRLEELLVRLRILDGEYLVLGVGANEDLGGAAFTDGDRDAQGVLYGTTIQGGNLGNGTVFSVIP